MQTDVIKRITIEAKSRGVAEASADLNRLAAAQDGVAVASDRTERRTLSVERAYERLARQIDADYRATKQFEAAQRTLNAAMDQGLIDQARYSNLIDLAAERQARAAVATRAAAVTHAASAGAVKLNTGQVQNLTFQLNDMATMLASGQSPFVMMMQQGMQMAQGFGPGTGLQAALKGVGTALVSFVTNPLNLAVVGIAAAAGGVKLLWDAVSSSADAERALEQHKALIEDIRDAYGAAGEAATRYAAKSAEVLQFRTASALSSETRALKAALSEFAGANYPGEALNPSAVAADFGPLNDMVKEFITTIRDGTANVAAFEVEIAKVGNATDDIRTDAAVAQVLALIEPLLKLEQQARQTAGATQLFSGTVARLGATRFADAFGDLDGLKSELEGFLDDQKRAAEEAARSAQQRADAIKGVTEQLQFEADQLGRTAREQAIYNALRQAGTTLDTEAGRSIADLAGRNFDLAAAQDALNDRLREAKGLASGFAGTLVKGLMDGKGVVSALGDAVGGLSSTLGNVAGGFLGKLGGGGIFGSILSGLGGGLVSSLVSGIGGLFKSIFGNRAEERAEARLRREEKLQARREELARKEERRQSLQEARGDYADRAYFAGLDTNTLEGRLAQFDREAQRERQAVKDSISNAKKRDQQLAALDKALAAERIRIQKDFADASIAEAERMLEEINRIGRSIADYVNGLDTGADSPLSPQDRLNAAAATYQSQLALAQGGNTDAQSSITGYADAYLKAAREFYASSTAFQDIFAAVKAQLLGLPAVTGTADPVVQALVSVQTAIVDAVDLNRVTLAQALASGPDATAVALAPLFDTIDVNASGGITLAEMQTALGTTNDRLLSIFQTLDADGDGQITRLDLIKESVAGVAQDASISTVNSTLVGDQEKGLGGIKRWAKDTALWAEATAKTVNAVGAGVVPWMSVIAQRLYNISDRLKASDPLGGVDKITKGKIKSGVWTKPYAMGGVVDAFAPGGIVGNGIWNHDSVRARFAGGGDIMLAGGEGVINAAATRMIGPSVIDLINRTGRLPDNDNGRYFTEQNRVLVGGFRAMVETLGMLERRLARIEASNEGIRRAAGTSSRSSRKTKVA
ncbi:MAG: phage tail length tape measure family protein [Bauldia sp.]|nr:phage tail length tape measure family protein [Bauldia sp.]